MAEPGGYNQSGRAPKATVQITAEQLIREAFDRQGSVQKAPRQKVLDGEELSDYQMRRRREFEEGVRRNRTNIGEWLRYATWEESQQEIARSRSIYERALDVDARSQTVYIKYAEMEMKNKNINLARNLFDRAVTVLPRVSQFWYRFAYMEELVDNVQGAREVFDRWMQWEPEYEAWMAFIKFEQRYKEVDNVRGVFERLVFVHPEPRAWLRWAQFEETNGDADSVRDVFGRAIDRLGEEHMDQHVFISFAKFEVRMREHDRARAIYKYALQRLPRAQSQSLYNQYTVFEKQFGDTREVEEVVVRKRRMQYESMVKGDPRDYDAWIDYAKLEESAGDRVRIRDVYERAVAEHPRVAEKDVWRRYIYIWLFYALYEETQARDVDRARQVYGAALDLIPHERFTFGKLWHQYAWFELRQGNVGKARRALGQALGRCPKNSLFRSYINLELELREFDRVRTLYTKHIEFNAANCATWVEFARFESALGEETRARAVYELAVDQPTLDMPEILWKAFIDFELELGHTDRVRSLYERLLKLTDHVKVWISRAQFELDAKGQEAARSVFEEGDGRLRDVGRKEERLMLLEAWRTMESRDGDVEMVERRMPTRVRRRRELDDGSLEEYFDYVFPDDAQSSRFKLLAKAHMWKQTQESE
ncbi:NineTeen Complex (NTC) component [Coemansia sp. RSA 2131]|nr:NineTeen Complex (NTC) component [Coemansia sp. RSA 2131]